MPNNFLSIFSIGSTPGLITVIFSVLTPQLIAKFFVYDELEIILSTLS